VFSGRIGGIIIRDSFAADNIERELDLYNKAVEEVEWCAPDGLLIDLAIAPTVYPPGEDTGILCDSLSVFGAGDDRRLLEIGCGSGAVSIWAAMRGFKVHTCDINPLAVAALRGRVKEMGIEDRLEVVEGGPGEGDVKTWSGGHEFDLIIWNPPYLDPPEQGEPQLGPLEEAGMVDLDWSQGSGALLLSEIEQGELLRKDGTVLIIRSSTTIGRYLGEQAIAGGWASRSTVSMTFGDGEHLEVLAFWKPWGGREIETIREAASTNSMLLDKGGDIGRCLRAEIQTQGRGQREREWISNDGDMTASWLLEPMAPGLLQLAAGSAVMSALDSLQSDEVTNHWMKWPNDIWNEEGKISGTLAQSRTTSEKDRVVLGIGMNLTEGDLEGHASISGFDATTMAKRVDCALAGLLEKRDCIPDHGNEEIISAAWRSMSLKLNTGAFLSTPEFQGRAIGLDELGRLIIDTGQGIVTSDSTYEMKWSFNE